MTSMPCLATRARSAKRAEGGKAEDGERGGGKDALLGVPATLAQSEGRRLKEYQLVGLNWLWLMWRFRYGGILADEMGLVNAARTRWRGYVMSECPP